MSVSVIDHQHDPVLIFGDVATSGQQLMIQTGTIVFNFIGTAGEDWSRDRLRHPVLQLPADIEGFVIRRNIQAIASGAPASMSYSPPPAAGTTGGASGLVAQGNALLSGWADNTSGFVQVAGPVALPVSGGNVGSATVPILGAGWAVDRTRAVRAGNEIELLADLAVIGPSSLMRLAYSLFVKISNIDSIHATVKDHVVP